MSDNKMYNILSLFRGVTEDTSKVQLTESTQTETIYEKVDARGSITEAVSSLESEYKIFKEAAPSAGMTKKQKSAVVKKAVAGKDIGKAGKGFKQVEKAAKASGAKDPKAVAAAAMWKSQAKKVSEAFDTLGTPDAAAIAKRKRLQALKDKQEDDAQDSYGNTKSNVRKVAGKSYGGAAQKDADELDEGILDDIADKKAEKEEGNWWDKKPTSKTTRDVKGSKYGGSKQKDDKDTDELDEACNFDDKKVKNAAKLTNVPKVSAKQVAESSMRDHPIYTNPEAWDHYKKELDEENIAQAAHAQELEEISKLAGVTLPSAPIEQEPMLEMDDELDDEIIGFGGRAAPNASVDDDDNYGEPNADGSYGQRYDAMPHSGVNNFFDDEVDEVDEGNEFSGALAAAKASGAKEFEVAGKKYTVKEELNLEDYSLEDLEDFMVSEDFEQLDELSKKTLGSYISKAADNQAQLTKERPNPYKGEGSPELAGKYSKKINDRKQGISKAVNKLTNEELEETFYNKNTSADTPAQYYIAKHPKGKGPAGARGTPLETTTHGGRKQAALDAAKASGGKAYYVGGGKQTEIKEDINVNITANGEQDALNLIRKLSGMAEVQPTPAAVDLVDLMQGGEFIEVDEERDLEYSNSPQEQTSGIAAAIPSGTDLNRAKKQYRKEYPGDNPMAVAEAKDDTMWNKYSTMLKALIK